VWPPPAVVAPGPAPAPAPTWPPSWYPDPWTPGAIRWWDGHGWTGHTARPTAAPPEPFRTLPVVAAWLGLVVTAGSLVGARLVLEVLGRFDWPILVYALLVTVLGYGPMVAYCWWASRRWGTGSLADDVGARVRWVDLAWGPLVWISAWVGGITAAIFVYALRIPIKSNTEGIDRYTGDRGVLIAFLIVAVVVAPVVEELMFRGVVMRGLASIAPIWLAVVGQGLCFGAAHVDPSRGVGNLGLVAVLGAVGSVFGGAAYLLRRIGPTIVAHALYNGVVMVIVLVVHP
jgi:membrane protease YdiL (CAAX protease family)